MKSNYVAIGLALLSCLLAWMYGDCRADEIELRRQYTELSVELERVRQIGLAHERELDGIQARRIVDADRMWRKVNLRDSLLCHCTQWDAPTTRFLHLIADFDE